MFNKITEQFLIAACIATIETAGRLTEEFNRAMRGPITSNGWGMFSPPDMGKAYAMAALTANEERLLSLMSSI